MNAVAQLKAPSTAVCEFDFIPEHGAVCALVEDQQVAVFKMNDTLYALGNWDPFAEAFVMSRGILGDLKGQLCIASPIYKQHFNLETGVCLEDETIALGTWETEVVDGIVYVNH